MLHEMVATKGDLLAEEVKSFHVFLITDAQTRLLLGREGVTGKGKNSSVSF